MDALLLSLILCALVEGAGKGARVYRDLGADGVRESRLIAGLTVACAINALIAALAGYWIAPMLTPEARMLFFAAALGFAGGGLFLAPRSGGRAGRAPGFSRITAAFFVACFGGSAPLLIAGIAVLFADPWMAGIGGGIGCGTGFWAGSSISEAAWRRPVSIGLGSLMLLSAFLTAMAGLRLI